MYNQKFLWIIIKIVHFDHMTGNIKKNQNYFMSFYDSTVLIIEDSPAVTMMLTKYIQKIGFTKILTVDNGEDAVEKFSELLNLGILPLVFLDYELPDMCAIDIAPMLFSQTSQVKIILETSLEENDSTIRELFSLGITYFIPKPLRFEKIKEVVKTVEIEYELDESTGMELEIDKVKEHLQIVHSSSVIRIAQNCGYPTDHVLSFLRGLISKGEVLETNEIKEILCNQCDSVNTSTQFSCPKCNSFNFDQTKLIEHYDCGTIRPENTFENDQCPQCKKELKALGVDYKIMSSVFICKNCTEKFPEPEMGFNCLKCKNKFNLKGAKFVNSPTFKWLKEPINQNKSSEIENPEILNVVSETT